MNSHRSSVLLIQTPEGITFPLPLAGPVTRMLATLIDYFVIMVVLTTVMIILGVLGIFATDFADAAAYLATFGLATGYPMGCEWFWRGQTIGKRVLRLRVVDANGLRLQFHQVVIRNLLRYVDMLPALYFLGGLVAFLNKKSQRLGDMAANTIVIRNPQIRQPDIAQLMAGKYNSFRDYPHLAARLRHNTTPVEASVALHALLRRDELDPMARIKLFGSIAVHLKQKVEFPPDVMEGLTDEQYVRNAVDILFSR